MGILALTADERVADVKITRDSLSVALRDGRTITVPLAWYPRLFNATAAERKNWRIAGGGYGIHWPDVDEDLSTEGLLRGAPARPMSRYTATRNAQEIVVSDLLPGLLGNAVPVGTAPSPGLRRCCGCGRR